MQPFPGVCFREEDNLGNWIQRIGSRVKGSWWTTYGPWCVVPMVVSCWGKGMRQEKKAKGKDLLSPQGMGRE